MRRLLAILNDQANNANTRLILEHFEPQRPIVFAEERLGLGLNGRLVDIAFHPS